MLLDIVLSTDWLWGIGIVLFFTLIIIVGQIIDKNDAKHQLEISKLEFDKKESELKLNINELAQQQFEKFKQDELESYKKVVNDAALQEAKAELSIWRFGEEDRLRKDAVTRSMGVNLGRITEHLVPFSVHLNQFNPRDIRFIGSPIDLIIFDGITEKKDLINIYMVEVKTGGGNLSHRQKAIKDAIEKHRVQWHPVVVPKFEWYVPEDDSEQ
jgi:predicted Holliday junction resolvase-like endonuclease